MKYLNCKFFTIGIAILLSLNLIAQNELETCITVSTSPVPGVFEYDYTTGNWSFLNDIVEIAEEPNDMAYDENSQTLWVAAGNQLFPIDHITGNINGNVCTLSGINGSSAGYIETVAITAMTFHPIENVFYGVHRSTNFTNDLLFKINPNTCDIIPNAFGADEDYISIEGVFNGCVIAEMYKIDGLEYNAVTDEFVALFNTQEFTNLVKINVETGEIYFVYVEFCTLSIDGFSIDQDGNFILTTGFLDDGSNRAYIYDPISNLLESNIIDNTLVYEDFEAVECFTASLCSNVLSTDDIESCEPFTWIDGNTYSESNNTATFTIPGAIENGCDSIINLNLTIIDSPGIITVSSDNSIFTTTVGDIYQWLNCGNNYSVIAGETSDEYIAMFSGTYAVAITTLDGCTDTSECTSINIVGLNDFLIEDAFDIYPNPSSGPFTVEPNFNQKIEKVTIYNIIGKMIDQKVAAPFKFNLTNSPGVYFVKIETDQGNIVKRIVKE